MNREDSKDFPSVIEDYVKTYKALCMTSLPWMPGTHSTLQTDYVQQELVWKNREDNLGKSLPQKSINVEQLFKSKKSSWPRDRRNSLSILVEGPPGCGKSTLALKLCSDWVHRAKYIRHFDLVILMLLKQWEGTVWDMIFKCSKTTREKDKNMLLHNLRDTSKKVLLVLDGLDEIPNDHKKKIHSILDGDFCRHATKVVLSRPVDFKLWSGPFESSMTVYEEKAKWDKRVYLKGIKQDSQLEFQNKVAEKFDSTKRDTIVKGMNQLQVNSPLLSELLRTPLLLQIVFMLLAEGVETTLTNDLTLTKLYKGIFNCMFQRRFYRSDLPTKTFDLFEEGDKNVTNEYADLMKQLGFVAFTAIKDVSTWDDVVKNVHNNKDILNLGFLVVMDEKYQPVHQSFIDFAAAYYLYVCWHEINGAEEIWCILQQNCFSNACSFLLPFLIGLMGGKANLVFDSLKPSCSLMSLKYFTLSLLQVKLTESILISLQPFIPKEIYVPSDDVNSWSFSNSQQHADIIRYATEQGITKTITWDVGYSPQFPKEGVKVDTLKLHLGFSLTSLNEQYAFTCKELHCCFRSLMESETIWTTCKRFMHCCLTSSAVDNWQDLLKFIDSCTFDNLSFDFDPEAMSVWFPAIYDTITRGGMKHKIKRMTCCFRRGQKVIMPKLRNLMENGKMDEVEISAESGYHMPVDFFYFIASVLISFLPVLTESLYSFSFIVEPINRGIVSALLTAVVCLITLVLLSKYYLPSIKLLGPIRISVQSFVGLYVLFSSWIFIEFGISKWLPITLTNFLSCIFLFSHFFAHVIGEGKTHTQPPRTDNHTTNIKCCQKFNLCRIIFKFPKPKLVQRLYLTAALFGSSSLTLYTVFQDYAAAIGTLLFVILAVFFLVVQFAAVSTTKWNDIIIVVSSIALPVLSIMFAITFYSELSVTVNRTEAVCICISVTIFLYLLPLILAQLIPSVLCRIFACTAISLDQIKAFKESATKSHISIVGLFPNHQIKSFNI